MAGGWKAGAVSFVALVGCLLVPASAEAKARPRTDVEVFMRLDATAAQTKNVGAVIRRSHAVRKSTFVSHADAYREFKALFASQPDLGSSTTADQLPESFRITLAKSAKAKPLVRRLEHLPGVDEVKSQSRSNSLLAKMTDRMCKSAKNTKVDFEVSLKVNATATQAAAVRATLDHSRAVERVKFVSKHEARREMLRMFATQPGLAAGVSADAFPRSFRVELHKHAHAKQLTRTVKHLPGVESVDSTARLRAVCKIHPVGPVTVP
jgi:cell division protein FtsX